jgi:hypothetical protein
MGSVSSRPATKIQIKEVNKKTIWLSKHLNATSRT